MNLNIIFMDKDIMLVEKPAGLAVQTGNLMQKDLVSEIKNHISKTNGIPNPYLGVIHRLDQPVRGILIFALNEKAAASLSRQAGGGGFTKFYRAEVEGLLDTKGKWCILSDYLVKDKNNKARVTEESEKNSKKAELKYKTVKTNEIEKTTILDIELLTGRFHQIRAQLSNTGHPIVNDIKYGAKKREKASDDRSIALCAYRLSFIHPSTKKWMEYSLPVDFSN